MNPNLTTLFDQASDNTLQEWERVVAKRLLNQTFETHGQALIEALDRMTALVMETNKPGTLYSGDKDLIVSSIELLATLEREAGEPS
jgi:hypothetical protein